MAAASQEVPAALLAVANKDPSFRKGHSRGGQTGGRGRGRKPVVRPRTLRHSRQWRSILAFVNPPALTHRLL